MYADAHIHLVDLAHRDPDFASTLPSEGWTCCAACHDEPEWREQSLLLDSLAGRGTGKIATSFGIHPQWPVWKNADLLTTLAREGRIDMVGEAGFDFFGDTPERLRTEQNEATQRAVFEFQLGLAGRYGLPLLVHIRKAMDLVYEYGARLARIGPVLFHCYSGTEFDIQAILRRGIDAWFSFGTPLLKGNKRAARACAAVPAGRLLAETDAPWQPPRGSEWTGIGHIVDVVAAMAALRGENEEAMRERLHENFVRFFAHGET
jgi:TatD DNase family protein